MSFTDCEERNDNLTKPHSSLGVHWVNIGNDDGHKSGLRIMFSLLPRTPHLARTALFATSPDHDVHCQNISATQSVNATMCLPHKRAERPGAQRYTSCASQQSVASVQSCRARLTPRLLDAKPQGESEREKSRQTHRHTHRQTAGNIRCNIIIAACYGAVCAERKRAKDLKEFQYLPKIRREVRCDSSPNF